MCQRLNLGQALLGDPEVLIMDEPIEGLDPRGVRDFFELLQQGRLHTVVLTSHRLSEVCPRVDRVCILDGGAVRALGSVEELLRDLKRPVQVHIYPVPSTNGTVESVLRGLQSRSLEKKDGKWVVEVSQEDKVAFLTGLGACNGSIQRIYVEEPSLEEVYFEAD